jgi:hypothetical protein
MKYLTFEKKKDALLSQQNIPNKTAFVEKFIS